MKMTLATASLAACLLSACATQPGVGATPIADLPKIDIGRTTMKEVRDRLGPPQGTGKMPFKDLAWWEYLVTDTMQVDHLFSIFFSSDGVARETGMIRHPKYDAPGGYQ